MRVTPFVVVMLACVATAALVAATLILAGRRPPRAIGDPARVDPALAGDDSSGGWPWRAAAPPATPLAPAPGATPSTTPETDPTRERGRVLAQAALPIERLRDVERTIADLPERIAAAFRPRPDDDFGDVSYAAFATRESSYTAHGRFIGVGDIDSSAASRARPQRPAARAVRTIATTVSPGCDAAHVRAVLERRAARIGACYATSTSPTGAHIVIGWSITPDGRTSLAAGSRDGADDLTALLCVQRHVRNLRFTPERTRGCVVRWTAAVSAVRP